MKRAALTFFVVGMTASWLAETAYARRSGQNLTRPLRAGWCAMRPEDPVTAGREVVVFTADGPSATITFTAYNGGQRLDNLYLVELDMFDAFSKRHDDSVIDCDTSDLIYDFDALGSHEEMLEIFDEEPRGWRFGNAAWTDEQTPFGEPGSAPRIPFGPLDERGGSIAFEPGGWASTTVEGLQAGKVYVIGGWWYWVDGEEGLAITIDTNLLALHNGRFEVRATWRTGRESGQGHAIPLSDVMGLFWLNNPEGADVMIKLLERCAVDNYFAISIGGLVDRQVTLVITDTQTGRVVTYENPFGTLFEPYKNRQAFRCP